MGPYSSGRQEAVDTATPAPPPFVRFHNAPGREDSGSPRRYLRLREDEGLGWGVISGAWASGSYLAIAPLQDVLGLGSEGRINTPSTTGENWQWRATPRDLTPELAPPPCRGTHPYGRLRA